MATQKILLLKDVYGLGRKGEVVKAAAGYLRNYLLPKQFAVTASVEVQNLQKKLQAEREIQAKDDKKESTALSAKLEKITLVIERKADRQGHMYGSVTVLDLITTLEEKEGIVLDKHNIRIGKPIKTFAVHTIPLLLKEGVECEFTLKILQEGHPEEALLNAEGELTDEAKAAEASAPSFDDPA